MTMLTSTQALLHIVLSRARSPSKVGFVVRIEKSLTRSLYCVFVLEVMFVSLHAQVQQCYDSM